MTGKPTGTYSITAVGGEQVKAFIPGALPPALTKRELAKLAAPLRRAEAALNRLRLAGEIIPSLDWFVYSFVRKEALLSSEIEGTQATLVDVFFFEQTGRSGWPDCADVEEVANYVRSINYAFGELESETGLPISARLFDECHRRLMRGARGKNKQPDEMRRSQVWIGGARPGNAAFVPPPADRVRDLLADLERYIHADDALPKLLRIAAAHAQFETIHPYLDGNGRLGRMLIALLLSHWGLLDKPLLYLSLYLKKHQAAYYERLNAVRVSGDWLGWFEYFLEGVASVARDACQTASDLHALLGQDRRKLLATARATVSALRLFELLPSHPVVSMPLVATLLNTSRPTATKTIDVLRDAAILADLGARKRSRLYHYQSYIKLLK